MKTKTTCGASTVAGGLRMRRIAAWLAIGACGCGFVGRSPQARGTAFTWEGAVDFYDVVTQWSPDSGVGGPTSGDDVSVPSGTVTLRATRSIDNLSIAAPATFNVLAGASSVTMTVANGFSNLGALSLDSTAAGQSTLAVTTGTLVNDGDINAKFGTGSSHARFLQANLNNSATGELNIDANTTLSLTKTGGAYANNGSVNIGAGGSLNFAATSGTFNQNGGTVVNNGGFVFNGDTLNFNGGSFSGNPVELQSSTLNIGVGSTGSGTFVMQLGSGVLSGDIATAQRVDILGTASTAATTASSGFANNGELNLDSTAAGSATFAVTTGTLVNNGVLNAKFGTGSSHVRQLQSNVDNAALGSVTVENGTTLSLTKAGGTFSNNGSVSIGTGSTLNFGGTSGTFSQNAGTVVNNGNFVFSADTLNFNGGSFSGNPIELQSSALNIGVGSTGAGTFVMQLGSGSLSGDIAAAQRVDILGTASSASTTASTGFSNNGQLNLDSNAAGSSTLAVTSGTLVNNGTFSAKFGTGSSHIRQLQGDLNNAASGTVNVEAGTTFSLIKAAGTYSNSGALAIGTGSTLNFGGTTGTFNQNAGTVANNGSFIFSSDTLNFNGGSFSGNPVELQSSTLNIGVGSTGAGTFVMQLGSGSLSGDIAAAQRVDILGTASSASTTASTGFANNGQLNLDSNAAGSSTLAVTSGTLVNNGTLNAKFGTGSSHVRQLQGSLNNAASGTVNIEAGTTLSLIKVGGTYSNSGALAIGTGSTLNFGGTTGTFNQNAGTVLNNGNFVFSGDTLNFNGGSFSGDAIELQSSTLNIGVGSTGAGTFLMQLASGSLSGDIAAAQRVDILGTSSSASTTAATGFANNGQLNLDSTAAGSATFSVTTGTLVNNGTLSAKFGTGSSHARFIQANLNNSASGSVFIEDGTTLTFNKAGGTYQNQGLIEIGSSAVLSITAGTLVNGIGGTIQGSGQMTLLGGNGVLANSGVVEPGLSPGQLTIQGDLANDSSSVLRFEIGGLNVGTEYDRLIISDLLDLGNASLHVKLINGFVPASGDIFEIIHAANIGGVFGNLEIGSRVETIDGRGSFFVQSILNSPGTDFVRLSDFIPNIVSTPDSTSTLSVFGLGLFALIAFRRADQRTGGSTNV